MSIELTPSLAVLVDPLPGHALRAAATLRLADLIAAGADTATALATAAGADADAVTRLMRYLCSRGIFQSHEGRYGLTEFSQLLLDDDPSGLRKTLDLDSYGDRFDRAVAELVDVVRSGEPAYPRLYGSTVYDDLAADPALGTVFADVGSMQGGITRVFAGLSPLQMYALRENTYASAGSISGRRNSHADLASSFGASTPT
jgi:hypothetical protein